MTAPAPILRFLGAAGTVTGSKFLLTFGDHRVLVDCGLFQGLKQLRLMNWEPLPLDARAIDAVLLTHAHLDHSGFIPRLVRDGFRGKVISSPGTQALCRILLPDSGHLQEEEADYANLKGYSKHSPALPLYRESDAWNSLGYFSSVEFDAKVEVGPITARFLRAGHILGSSLICLEINSARRVLFSGDLGRPYHPLLRPPAPPPAAEVIVIESTYGDRIHDDTSSLQRFADAIAKTVERGGVVVIPSYAVDRTEVVLHHLAGLRAAGRIPRVPIFVDSPMALAALRIYEDSIERGSPEIRDDIAHTRNFFNDRDLTEIKTVEESMRLNAMPGPMIIISASGMASGGRVLHHLKRRLPDRRNTVILVGYQTEGTRGRSLLEGAQMVKMLGAYVPVSAEVVEVPAFSAHADQNEIVNWLKQAKVRPQLVYVVHGAPAASEALRARIVHELGWNAVAPRNLEQVRIG
ncbi:MAG: MBL fold metallo-hydrolase [Candidatus Binatus sp.]|uniref:MBL fold metallo-hydrolase RNA specificity domain-containing protein n=1 Tax=Candidatus Binatus sp. TaxID=2811406 RepID=UPI0027165D85|nr:MBL fold metallo-hydrolase [Candidatus Binatus sp.]MDO8432619.1 MBL fold metallo-hydrolase [Candidatus Binatus sp.]